MGGKDLAKIIINRSNTKEKRTFLGNIYKNDIDKNEYLKYNDYTGLSIVSKKMGNVSVKRVSYKIFLTRPYL